MQTLVRGSAKFSSHSPDSRDHRTSTRYRSDALCHQALSHYQNQCWLLISEGGWELGAFLRWWPVSTMWAGPLTHWGQVTHICLLDLTNIGSDNGLSPARCQTIIWTNAGILLIEPSGTNFSEILIGIQIFSFKKMCLKMLSAKWRPFCLSLNVLIYWWPPTGMSE